MLRCCEGGSPHRAESGRTTVRHGSRSETGKAVSHVARGEVNACWAQGRIPHLRRGCEHTFSQMRKPTFSRALRPMSAWSTLLGGGLSPQGDEGLKGAGFLNNRTERAASHADTAIKPFTYVVMASRADVGAISCHEEAQAFLPTSAFRLLCQASSQV